MRIYRGKAKQNGEWAYGYFVKEKSYLGNIVDNKEFYESEVLSSE